MPTLIVWGDEDRIIPVQHAETWRKLVPHADIRIYKGAGHLVHLEKPEAADAIANFGLRFEAELIVLLREGDARVPGECAALLRGGTRHRSRVYPR